MQSGLSVTSPLNPEHSAAVYAELSARSNDIEAAGRLPQDLADKMANADFYRLVVPEALGGLEAHPQVFFDTLAATAQADSAAGWCLMIGTTTSVTSSSLPTEHAQAIYGTDPKVITAGVTAPMGRADIQADGSVIASGRWPYGSGSQTASWIAGGCTLYKDGEVVTNRFDQPATMLVFFERDQVDIHDDTWQTSGLRGTGSHDFSVNQAHVPEGRWVELGGRPRIDTPLYRFPTLGLLALGVSAVSIGIARHALSVFHKLAVAKTPTGGRRTLANRGAVQADYAMAQAAVDSAEALTRQTIATAWDQASNGQKIGLDMKAKLRLAATHNTWSAAQAVDRLYHAGGGTSIYSKSPLQRCFRDVHVTTQHIMVAQPTYEMTGKVALDIDPKQPL